MVKGKSGRRSTIRLALGAMLAAGLGMGLGFLLAHTSCERRTAKPEAPQKAAPSSKSAPRPPFPRTAGKTVDGPASPAREREEPRFALIIDDLGYAEPELVRRLCSLPIAFSVAVLPYQEHTRESADIAYASGKEVLLHFPMEGAEGKDPGPDALLDALPEAELRARAKKALWAVPHIAGTNNHMGSRLTADRAKIRVVLEEVKARKIWFVDSRTTKETVARDVAEESGMKTAQRDVFLDGDKAFPEIEKQWNRAMAIAKREGTVVVIGHIYPETVEALEKLVRRDRGEARFVKAGDVVK